MGKKSTNGRDCAQRHARVVERRVKGKGGILAVENSQ